MTVIVDSREGKQYQTMATKYLSSVGEVSVQMIDSGDYVYLKTSSAIERKEIKDYVGSVKGRIWEQVLNLVNNFDNPYVIIVGRFDEAYFKQYHDFSTKMFLGSMASITARSGVPVFHVENNKEFFILTRALMLKSDGENRGVELIRRARPKYGDIVQGMLSFVPGIGPENARRIIEHCKVREVRDLCDLELESLMEVPGIGRKRGLMVKEYFK